MPEQCDRLIVGLGRLFRFQITSAILQSPEANFDRLVSGDRLTYSDHLAGQTLYCTVLWLLTLYC